MTQTEGLDVERLLFDALYTDRPPENHGQLCPVWTKRRSKGTQTCDCWVADRDHRLAKKLAAALAASAPVAEGRLDFIAHAEHIRNEHDATHGEAEMCGAECIVMGLAADEWLDERLQEDGRKWRAAEAEGHVVTFTETGYGLMHPPSCRPDLIGCPYNAHLAGLNRPARKPGRYRMVRVRTRFTYAAAPCRLPHQRGQGDE